MPTAIEHLFQNSIKLKNEEKQIRTMPDVLHQYELLRQVLKYQEQQKDKHINQCRGEAKKLSVPWPEEFLEKICKGMLLNQTYEILEFHPGHSIDQQIQSIKDTLSIFNSACKDIEEANQKLLVHIFQKDDINRNKKMSKIK